MLPRQYATLEHPPTHWQYSFSQNKLTSYWKFGENIHEKMILNNAIDLAWFDDVKVTGLNACRRQTM